MANTQAAEAITLPVATATVISQYRFVSPTATGGTAEHVDTAGNPAAGVSLESSSSTSDASISVALLKGRVKVQCGGNITAGSWVSTNTEGEAVSTTTKADALGIALEAGADGRVISIVAF